MFHTDAEVVHRRLVTDLEQEGQVVILCGAGISRDSPTRLPLAWEIREMFHDAIRDASVDVCGKPVVDWVFIKQMMPENILSSFFSVFSYDVFQFMDPFFERPPNANHSNFIRLAQSGAVSDIITLNFDFELEAAWRALTQKDITPITSYDGFLKRAGDGFRLHKPHGTIDESCRYATPRDKYRDLRFTIERIGTAKDDELSAWFQHVLGGKVLVVTGYSAQDLDIFPALRSVEGIERIYWNFYKRSDWEARRTDAPAKKALCEWLDGAYLLFGPIARHLPPILKKLSLEPSALSGNKRNEPHGCSVGTIKENKAGLLLSGALALHSINRPGQEKAVRTILNRLQKYTSVRDEVATEINDAQRRFNIMANQLHADLLQEDSSPKAYRAYRESVRLLDHYPGEDKISAEMTPRQARCKMLWSAMRRTSGISTVFRPIWSFFRLWLMGHRWEAKDPGARRLAQHFFGGVFFRLALYLDVILDLQAAARWLHEIAYRYYARATQPLGSWRAQDAFHFSRADEAWLFSRRRIGSRKEVITGPGELERRLIHYGCVQCILEGDVGLAQVLLLRSLFERLTSAPGKMRDKKVRKLLRQAVKMYATRNYRAGIERAQVYRWICDPGPRTMGSLAQAIVRVATLKAIQRHPAAEAQRLSCELQPARPS